MDKRNRGNIPAINDYETQLSGLYEEYYDKIARYVYVHIGSKESRRYCGRGFLESADVLEVVSEQGVPMQGGYSVLPTTSP